MREAKLEEVVEAVDKLRAETDNFSQLLSDLTDENGNRFDFGQKLRRLDCTTADLISRIQAVIGIAAEFKNSTRADLAPVNRLDAFRNALETTAQRVHDIQSEFNSHVMSAGGLKSFNYEIFQATTKNNNVVEFSSKFNSLFDAVEGLLNAFFEILFILEPRASFSFQGAASSFSTVIAAASGELDNISNLARESGQAMTKLQTEAETTVSEMRRKNDAVSTNVSEVERLKTQSASDRQTIGEYHAEATQKISAIREQGDAASALANQVTAYKASFESFQKQLDAREKQLDEGNKSLSDLIDQLNTQQEEIADTIDKSQKMLSSATISGLAANFARIKDDLTGELGWARWSFYLGILFLLVSAIPLIIFVFLPIIAPLIESYFPGLIDASRQYVNANNQTGWQYLGQVLARFVILIPAAWFVSFAAIRYSSLFRLIPTAFIADRRGPISAFQWFGLFGAVR